MSCEVCKREKPAVARGLCNACYQRWRKTGSTEYQRWGKRSVCGVGGCDRQVVSGGLCDAHRKRLARHGHTEETRPDSWGAKTGHPLYNTWLGLRRYRAQYSVVKDWSDDFLQFAHDVGDRPSPTHGLYVADDSKPLGPGNFVWKRAVTERVEGEDQRTYMNRVQKVYRAVRREAFHGYSLKRQYGLSRDDYDRMLAEQGGKCAICARPETAKHPRSGEPRSLAIDHCHTGGHVRALLCSKCNTGIGSFEDDPARLRAAIEYLERHAPPETPPGSG